MDVFEIQVPRAHGQAGGRGRPASDHQCVEVRKSKREGRAPAAVAFGVLIVVGRLEGADGLAHEREVSGERPDGEDERLFRVVPGPVREPVFVEKQGRQPAPAGNGVSAVEVGYGAPPGGKIDDEYSEMIPDHDASS